MSVHKDKNTGKWYYTGKYRDLLGNRHDYKKRGFRTKGEAKDAEDAFLLRIKGGQGRIKMKALIELYHKEAGSSVKASTLKQYARFERQAIVPYFGDRFIDSIKPLEVKSWINDIAQNGIDGKSYGESSTRNMLLHLSGLFTFAVDHDLLSRNPCKKIKPPRDPNKIEGKQLSETNFWEADEYKRFIDTVVDSNHKRYTNLCF